MISLGFIITQSASLTTILGHVPTVKMIMEEKVIVITDGTTGGLTNLMEAREESTKSGQNNTITKKLTDFSVSFFY